MKKFLVAIALLLSSAYAIAQPSPPPSPWIVNGSQVSYDGCVTVPTTATCEGNGTFNSNVVYSNGVQVTTAANTLTSNALIIGNGSRGMAPLGSTGTATTVLHGGAGAPSFGAVALTTDVSGTLPVASGGTNVTSASITAFNNITGYSASGATGTTSSNLVFSASPTLTGTVTVPVTGSIQCLQASSSGILSGSGSGCASAVTPNFKTGMILSTAGSSATFGITAGTAANSTNTTTMALASAYTKTTSSWAVGTAAGCLDTGAVANNTWYHVFEIERLDTLVVDVLCSTNVSAPTLPANYTVFRRVGSMRTDSSAHWLLFRQYDNTFYWNLTILDKSGATGSASFAALAFTVPPGVNVRPLFSIGATNVSTNPNWSIADGGFVSAGTYTVLFQPSAGATVYSYITSYYTNTSSQLQILAGDGNSNYTIYTQGWVDDFGIGG